jgi:hypothetical protein
MNAVSILRVSGPLTEQTAYARSDPAPKSDHASGDAIVESDLSLAGAPPQIERVEDTLGLHDDIERWRWIVLGLGWGW